MTDQYRNRGDDLFGVQRIFEHVAPDDHVRGEEIRFDLIKDGDVHGTDDGEDDDHRHGSKDRSQGIITETGKHHGETSDDG